MTIYVVQNKIASMVNIDRKKMGIQITKEQKTYFFSEIWKLLKKLKNVLKVGYVTISPNHEFRKGLYYQLKKGQGVARITVGSTQTQYCYVSWEVWPHRLGKSEFYLFHNTVLQHLNNDPIFHYQTIYLKGKIQYIELACDLLTPNIHGLIFWRNNSRKSSVYGDENEKGTIYIGGKNSGIRFRIYDKGKQLKENGEHTTWDSFTRIEVELKKTKLAPCQLANIKNPFISLGIASAIDCKNHSTDPDWHQFIDTALEKGSAIAFSGLSKYRKNKYKEWLSLYAAKFWKPAKIMNAINVAMEPIKPENLFSSTSTISA